MDKNLKNEYESTTYTTDPPTIFQIKIHELNPELNKFLADNNFDTWTYITAENPFSKELTEVENTERNKKLENEIQLNGFSYLTGQGIPENANWTPENSFLVFNISLSQARKMAQAYQQNAIVYGSLTTLPELICIEY